MLLTTTDYVVLAIGYIILFAWLIIYIKGLKYSQFFEGLDEEEFRLKDMYGFGYAVMEMIHYEYKSNSDRKLRKEVEVLYGEKYADYFLRVAYAQKVTLSSLVLVFAFIMYGLGDSLMITVILAGLSGAVYYYIGESIDKKIESRSEEMLSDFSNIVSKLALLTNAGMILREAWKETAYTGNTTIYIEMQKTCEDIDNGISEVDAYYSFGNRCVIPEVKKFVSTISQGATKGNAELVSMLQQQSKEVWKNKKNLVKIQAEKAAGKLMIPIFMMFIGIMIMVIVPIFANLGV